MLRRRAAFEAARQGVPRMRGDLGSVNSPCSPWRAVMGCLRGLTALAYALAGSFEDAVGNWRSAVDRVGPATAGVLDRAEDLLARVGQVAHCSRAWPAVEPDALDVATARGAWRIVQHSLWIWVSRDRTPRHHGRCCLKRPRWQPDDALSACMSSSCGLRDGADYCGALLLALAAAVPAGFFAATAVMASPASGYDDCTVAHREFISLAPKPHRNRLCSRGRETLLVGDGRIQ